MLNTNNENNFWKENVSLGVWMALRGNL